MVKSRLICSIWVACLMATAASAQPAIDQATRIRSGEYVSEDGWGTLKVWRDKASRTHFRLDALGSNGHSCLVEGEIKQGRSAIPALEPDKPCIVAFVSDGKADAWNVGIAGEPLACRYFCGVRADFVGRYARPPRGCAPTAVRKTRNDFKTAYRRKDYATAAVLLAPVLANCAATLVMWDLHDVRNDLANTYYHLKRKAACLDVMKPLENIVVDTEEDIQATYPPGDADGLIAVRKTAIFNLQRCRSLR